MDKPWISIQISEIKKEKEDAAKQFIYLVNEYSASIRKKQEGYVVTEGTVFENIPAGGKIILIRPATKALQLLKEMKNAGKKLQKEEPEIESIIIVPFYEGDIPYGTLHTLDFIKKHI